MRRWCLAIIALLVVAAPMPAASCRLALVLAIDVSTSVDQRDYSLQRDGLAAALRAPEVISAFLSAGSPVALSAYEWSGRDNQRIILDWTLMTSSQDMSAAADRIETFVRYQTGYPTSLGRALSFGGDMLAAAPICGRQPLDLSGDGRNNDSYTPEVAYQDDLFDSVTVNALAVGGGEPLDSLVRYFTETVIRGQSAFVEVARNHEDFEKAMRRKLVREVTSLVVSHLESEQ
ncbi:MAG: DUF1194 domain-containing protein [Boseongicola sp.]